MKRGTLELYCGPMFSGKTDALIARYRDSVASGMSSLAVKPALDTRHPRAEIVSHSGARIPARSVVHVDELAAPVSGISRVFLDEVQFFEPSLLSLIDAWRTDGKNVVAAGLDLDFRRAAFAVTAAIGEVATHISTLTARCGVCSQPAQLTQRLIDDVPAPLDQPVIVVGDRDLYEPRCTACWERERAGIAAPLPAHAV